MIRWLCGKCGSAGWWEVTRSGLVFRCLGKCKPERVRKPRRADELK